MRQWVEQAISRTRSLTFELSPPVLHELGLGAAVEWLGEQMEKVHGFTFAFHNDEEPKPVDEEVGIFSAPPFANSSLTLQSMLMPTKCRCP